MKKATHDEQEITEAEGGAVEEIFPAEPSMDTGSAAGGGVGEVAAAPEFGAQEYTAPVIELVWDASTRKGGDRYVVLSVHPGAVKGTTGTPQPHGMGTAISFSAGRGGTALVAFQGKVVRVVVPRDGEDDVRIEPA
jgi:hypothetical protein